MKNYLKDWLSGFLPDNILEEITEDVSTNYLQNGSLPSQIHHELQKSENEDAKTAAEALLATWEKCGKSEIAFERRSMGMESKYTHIIKQGLGKIEENYPSTWEKPEN